ncbi:MAG TPA: SDR family oxidoreductase [Gammaproteobacteria bacterium]|nr:SDR family oxidoreductase [Gammaproteobacteria bacterium]
MQTLRQKRALVVGGSRGLGRGVVEALVAQGAAVTVLARDAAQLQELQSALGVATLRGDATDAGLAESALRELRPQVLVVNAGATPAMAPLHQQTWETFSKNWDTDVQASFHWAGSALRLPLEPGSRVLLTSSGAAVGGSPLSGGYAGAKRMIWFMAGYANGVAKELGLDIHFQALVTRQIVGATALGRGAAEAYARRQGVTAEAFLAGFGKPMEMRAYGDHVVTLLSEPRYQAATAFGLRAETGIEVIEA